MSETKCPKCGSEENFHYNYDYTKKDMPVEEILCNECGEFFKPLIMSEKQQSTPIQTAILWCDYYILSMDEYLKMKQYEGPKGLSFIAKKEHLQEFKKHLQSLLEEERAFAEATFLAGQFHGEEISEPSYRATHETEHPDFDDYYTKYTTP